MNAIDIEKLNQLISRTDISGNDKIKWLTDFIDSREFGQQERMYSEEEVVGLLSERSTYVMQQSGREEKMASCKEWFEQFKKK
jgi:hypothetical protein